MRGRSRLLIGAGVVLAVVVGVFVLTPGALARSQFVLREQRTSCGEVEHGVQGGGIPADARDCLDAAWESGAELTVMTPTTEGDPTFTYYRVWGGGLEIFHDTSGDTYGPGTWSRSVCPGDDLEGALERC
ncbi:hypothetical protein [Isoptericola sp. NPDC060257]|uniref:hypothetical protein n=1 Tax=Isoptericola sp. NPDC060257 TaxID=3347087 RepID=UPI003651360A